MLNRFLLIGICMGMLFVINSSVSLAPIWYGSGDDTGLAGRWSCEGNFMDGSGQGNHGTQSRGVTILRGVKGRACGFDGTEKYL